MQRCSRRRALAIGGAALVPVTAGCSVLSSSEEGERTDFRDWLPGEELWAATEPQITYESLQPILQAYPQDHERSQDVQSLGQQFGLGSFRFERRLTVETPDLYGVVILGDFEADDVLETMDLGNTTQQDVGDYTLVGGAQAVGPGAIVYSSAAERFVETARGEAERIADVDTYWERILENDAVVDTDLFRLAAHDSASFRTFGIGADVEEGPSFEGTAVATFASEADASEGHTVTEAAIERFVAEDVETQLRDSRVDGDVVEYDVGWTAFPF